MDLKRFLQEVQSDPIAFLNLEPLESIGARRRLGARAIAERYAPIYSGTVKYEVLVPSRQRLDRLRFLADFAKQFVTYQMVPPFLSR